jgi:hypothetical protein
MKPTHTEKCLSAMVHYTEPDDPIFTLKCLSCNSEFQMWGLLLDYCHLLKVPACSKCRNSVSILQYFIDRVISPVYQYTTQNPQNPSNISTKLFIDGKGLVRFDLGIPFPDVEGDNPETLIIHREGIKHVIPLQNIEQVKHFILGVLDV